MKNTLAALLAAISLATFSQANAAEAQGAITSTDAGAKTMTLDDGKTYVLPDAFDFSLIGPGMKVVLAYDEEDGRNVVTDMEQVE